MIKLTKWESVREFADNFRFNYIKTKTFKQLYLYKLKKAREEANYKISRKFRYLRLL